jgi:predicted NUDIX family NTP pyrophosphohydrolase
MPKESAGILLYRTHHNFIEVLLVHPGGPFFVNKDAGSWTIPKGEIENDEDALAAAVREFKEETGFSVKGPFKKLTPIKQKAGKIVHAWACGGDIDAQNITSNTFEMEWPPKSGKMKSFAEVDRAEWFTFTDARIKINPMQVALLNELELML